MSVKTILTEPNKLLRQVSEPVKKVGDEERKLMDDMLDTMYNAPGIGLAAIQVGVPKRILVIDIARDDEARNPLSFINPEIIKKSTESITDFEGCLSAPGKQGEVKRYIRITLKYQDEEGEEIVKTFYNLAARCIQHEMDHLEGKLCIDYEKGNYSRDKHKSQTMVESDFRTKSDT